MQALYYASHILAVPSYHEGFCKPVIEGLRSGCVPVGYAGSNIPAITGGLGRLVAEGDSAGLGDALRDVAGAIRTGGAIPLDSGRYTAAAFDAAAKQYVQAFEYDGLARETVARVAAMAPDAAG